MSAVWSTLTACLVVLLIFSAEYLCEDDLFTGAAINVGNTLANTTYTRHDSRSNNQEWPALGQRHTQTSNSNREVYRPINSQVQSRIQTFSNAENTQYNKQWPNIGERRHTSNLNNNQNWNPSGSNSFVQSQIDRWNAHSGTHNNTYASSVNSRGQSDNVRPHQSSSRTNHHSSGIQFGEETGNDQGSKVESRANANQVTDNELREFSEQLLLKDENNAAKYVTINFQGRTTSRSTNDEAPLPLLSVSREAYSIPTIAKLQPLYDNYIVKSDVNEDYTNQEKQEENVLLKTILETEIMKSTRNFLIEKGAINRSEREFETLLHDMWFHLYSRGKRKVGSSAFEHVFLAEIKKNEVSGLHNWLYFEREEANRRSNYLGYLKKIDLGNKGAILKFNFDYHGINKPVGSMFIGTSPEFEMALYSTCFILRADRICPLKLNGHRFIIRTYTFRYDGKNLIGSAFPEI